MIVIVAVAPVTIPVILYVRGVTVTVTVALSAAVPHKPTERAQYLVVEPSGGVVNEALVAPTTGWLVSGAVPSNH